MHLGSDWSAKRDSRNQAKDLGWTASILLIRSLGSFLVPMRKESPSPPVITRGGTLLQRYHYRNKKSKKEERKDINIVKRTAANSGNRAAE